MAGPNSRYKLFSHVVVGESSALPGPAGAEQQPPRGAGMHIATRCMWDPAVDDMISESVTTVCAKWYADGRLTYACPPPPGALSLSPVPLSHSPFTPYLALTALQDALIAVVTAYAVYAY